MEIYRVEQRGTLDGPLINMPNPLYEHFHDEVGYSDERKYPNLPADGLPIDRQLVTGVLRRELVDHWFPAWSEFRKYLKENGYIVTTYEVHPDDVQHGASYLQLLFSRDKVRLVNQQEL